MIEVQRVVYSANDVRNAKSFKQAREMIIANFNNPAVSKLWLVRGLLAIFKKQTADEQNTEQTQHNNSVGFSAFDAQLLSSYAKQVLEFEAGRSKYSSPLSPKQFLILRQRMEKYAMQLARIARPVPVAPQLSLDEDIDEN